MFTIYTGFDKEFVYLYISSVRLQQTQLFILPIKLKNNYSNLLSII